jgi:hypothetical protein
MVEGAGSAIATCTIYQDIVVQVCSFDKIKDLSKFQSNKIFLSLSHL